MGNTMIAADLHRILHNGVLFADKNKSLPMIHVVRLEFTGNQVLSVATDRFTLGVTRADYAGEEFTVLLDRGDADRLSKLAKTVKEPAYGERRSVAIERNDKALTFTFSTGEALTLNTVEHEFPKWRQLLPEEVTASEQATYTAVDPVKMALFTKVAKHNDDSVGITLTFGKSEGPTLIRIGKHFVGLLMPVRGYQAWERPNWI